MNQTTFALPIPPEILERARQIARESSRSVESVLLDSLNLLFGTTLEDVGSPDTLKTYPDEQLWALVYRRLPWTQDARLRDLLALGQRGQLSAEEQGEMERLLEVVDHHMLLRSEALLLLKQRGHDVERKLKLGA